MATRKILLCFALPEEVVPVTIPGAEVITVVTGITKPYASARLAAAIAKHRPDLVVNIGTAGTRDLAPGDIVVCTRFIDRDVKRSGFTSVTGEVIAEPLPSCKLPSVIGGETSELRCTANTGDDFVTEAEDFDGEVIDMESFAEALLCECLAVPFLSVKYVTDVIGQNSMKLWEDKLADAREGLTAYFAAHANLV